MAKVNPWKNSTRGKYTNFYNSWYTMHQRAGNKDGIHPTYSDVTVCERWKSYDNFFEDMFDTWFKGATLDKDSILPGNRVYCKEYCKWVTKSENTKERNKRENTPENFKYSSKGKFGEYSHNHKKVLCIETGEIFNTGIDASNKMNINVTLIYHAANPNNRKKSAGGYHWKYVEEHDEI